MTTSRTLASWIIFGLLFWLIFLGIIWGIVTLVDAAQWWWEYLS